MIDVHENVHTPTSHQSGRAEANRMGLGPTLEPIAVSPGIPYIQEIN